MLRARPGGSSVILSVADLGRPFNVLVCSCHVLFVGYFLALESTTIKLGTFTKGYGMSLQVDCFLFIWMAASHINSIETQAELH